MVIFFFLLFIPSLDGSAPVNGRNQAGLYCTNSIGTRNKIEKEESKGIKSDLGPVSSRPDLRAGERRPPELAAEIRGRRSDGTAPPTG